MSSKIFGIFLVSIIFAILILSIIGNWELIKSYPWRADAKIISGLVIAAIPVYIVSAYSFHLILRALGARISPIAGIKIWLISNVSRFIPGTIWQYFSRVYLAKKEGISPQIASTAVAVEAMMSILVGSLTSLIILSSSKLILILIIPMIVVFLFMLGNRELTQKILHFLTLVTGKKITWQIQLPYSSLPALVFFYFLQFLLAGTVLFFLIQLTTEVNIHSILIFTGIYALSWLVGYITFFAPSGLGVQDLSMAGLLSSYIPFPIASLVAILFRIVLLATEMLTIFLAFWWLKKK